MLSLKTAKQALIYGENNLILSFLISSAVFKGILEKSFSYFADAMFIKVPLFKESLVSLKYF